MEQLLVYQRAVEDKGEQKYVTRPRQNLSEATGVVNSSGSRSRMRGPMAKAIEPWSTRRRRNTED